MANKVFGQDPRNFYKRNKVELMEFITPKFYLQDDIDNFGTVFDPIDQVIESHINFAVNVASILSISATDNFTSIQDISGISQFFIKQNANTTITPFLFDTNILVPKGVTISDFSTSADFRTYLADTLLPSIRLNSPTASEYATDASGTHEYLINNLSWMYFLNTDAVTYSPSAFVADTIAENIYRGKSINLVDGLKGLNRFIYNNYDACTIMQTSRLIPTPLLPVSSNTYASGTQQRDNFETLLEVAYSPLHSDRSDTKVQDAFEEYLSFGSYTLGTESAGPLRKLQKAIGYSMHDVDDEVERLSLIYDIENCPDNLLQYVAQIIGWKLYGNDPERWRLQLKNAVLIYKAKGTKKGIQLAIDSIFSENTFNLSGSVTELWESYIPNIVYYSLVTESSALTGFDQWTPQKAASLGIADYSTTNMDDNIRYVVDYIMLDTVNAFPNHFTLCGQPFPLGDPNFVFNYRGRVLPIPPWEDVKYYKDTEIDLAIIDYVMEKITCLGVDPDYVVDVANFIKGKTVQSYSDLHIDNRWLFFDDKNTLPPNYDDIVTYNFDKVKYLGMYSGKSSHFSLMLNASSFLFSPKSLDVGTSLALTEALRSLDEFTPAHAIPDTNLLLGETDGTLFNDLLCPEIGIAQTEFTNGSGTITGFEQSGINFTTNTFKRVDYNSRYDTQYSTSASVTGYPRNSHRRRNLLKILPIQSLFIRDGRAMPAPNEPSGIDGIPLGFIPSSCAFEPIPDFRNIPDVYNTCSGSLDSSSVFYGVAASDTMVCRGNNAIVASSCDKYTKRGNLDPIWFTMYKVMYNRSVSEAQHWLNTAPLADVSAFSASANFIDFAVFNANVSSNPQSEEGITDFAWTDGVHRIFRDYIRHYGKHGLTPVLLEPKGGLDVFSHTYGPLIYNGKLDINGSLTSKVSVKTDAVVILNEQNGLAASDTGTYTASTVADAYVEKFEIRNANVFSGMELVTTSGSSSGNQFICYRLEPSSTLQKNFTVYNGMVKLKAKDWLPRLRFPIASYGPSTNLLLPEHDFKLSVNVFPGNDAPQTQGGGSMGVWIHTAAENGLIWTYLPSGKWVMHESSDLKVQDVKSTYMHTTAYPTTIIPPEVKATVSGAITCLPSLESEGTQASLSIQNITQNQIEEFVINFSTVNTLIQLPNVYFKDFGQVHRRDQNYVIEVAMLPTINPDPYIMVEQVNLRDETQYNRAVELAPVDLLNSFKFFNKIAVNKASRVVSDTSSIFEVSGGSRVQYTVHPEWVKTTNKAASDQYTGISIQD